MRATFSTASTGASRGLDVEVAERLGALGVVAELSLGEGGQGAGDASGRFDEWQTPQALLTLNALRITEVSATAMSSAWTSRPR